jgi:hypothetical protein
MQGEPGIFQAIGAGFRAARANAWLAPVGMVVEGAGTLLGVPAVLFVWTLLFRGALLGLSLQPLNPLGGLFGGAAEMITRPRAIAIVAGLSLGGALLGGALRAAFLAGALPSLGRTLSGEGRRADFSEGLAWRAPRVIGTALLGFAVQLAAVLYLDSVLLGMALLVGKGAPPGAAFLGALALVFGIAAMVAASAVADAALARAAILDERPTQALAGAARAFLRRPAAFLLVALVLAAAELALTSSVNAFGAIATGFAQSPRVPPLVFLGPRLMVAAVAALFAAFVLLWRFGALAALACRTDER